MSQDIVLYICNFIQKHKYKLSYLITCKVFSSWIKFLPNKTMIDIRTLKEQTDRKLLKNFMFVTNDNYEPFKLFTINNIVIRTSIHIIPKSCERLYLCDNGNNHNALTILTIHQPTNIQNLIKRASANIMNYGYHFITHCQILIIDSLLTYLRIQGGIFYIYIDDILASITNYYMTNIMQLFNTKYNSDRTKFYNCVYHMADQLQQNILKLPNVKNVHFHASGRLHYSFSPTFYQELNKLTIINSPHTNGIAPSQVYKLIDIPMIYIHELPITIRELYIINNKFGCRLCKDFKFGQEFIHMTILKLHFTKKYYMESMSQLPPNLKKLDIKNMPLISCALPITLEVLKFQGLQKQQILTLTNSLRKIVLIFESLILLKELHIPGNISYIKILGNDSFKLDITYWYNVQYFHTNLMLKNELPLINPVLKYLILFNYHRDLLLYGYSDLQEVIVSTTFNNKYGGKVGLIRK
jgi:hypothetical protein